RGGGGGGGARRGGVAAGGDLEVAHVEGRLLAGAAHQQGARHPAVVRGGGLVIPAGHAGPGERRARPGGPLEAEDARGGGAGGGRRGAGEVAAGHGVGSGGKVTST